jgi:hypothetical protein
MDGRKARRPVIAGITAILAIASTAGAEVIHFSGNVENDFANGTPRVGVVVSSPDPNTGLPDPNDVGQSKWMTDKGWITGWNIKDIRFHYDAPSDNLYVGVNFFGIAGDADGNGNPGTADPLTSRSMGVDEVSLGGKESIAVALDINNDGKYDVVAGVPAEKSTGATGSSQFQVAKYDSNSSGIPYSFGEALVDHNGGLAFDPSAEAPDFEFLVKNFSKLPGMPEGAFEWGNGFGVGAFAGTNKDIVAGEDSIPYTNIQPQNIPEPSTILGWTVVVAGGLGWTLRRRGGQPAG